MDPGRTPVRNTRKIFTTDIHSSIELPVFADFSFKLSIYELILA